MRPAHAAPRSQHVPIRAGAIEHEIRVHPVYFTELSFPDDITRVAISDQQAFQVHAQPRRVLVRPKPDAAAGTLANLLIESKGWRVMVLLRVAAQPDDAVVSVTFALPDRADEPGAGAAPGTDTDATDDGTEDVADDGVDETADAADHEKDAAGGEEPASAVDRTEDATVHAHTSLLRAAPEPPVSVQVHGTVGRALVGDRMAANQATEMLMAGMAARVAYPWSRYSAYDAAITVTRSNIARYPDVMIEYDHGEMLRSMLLARFEVGASARLPARLTPVVRLGLGVQGRALIASRLVLASGAAVEAPGDIVVIDVTGSAGVGVDYRITQSWRAGLGVTAIRAVPLTHHPLFAAWEGSIHVRWN